MEIEEEVYVNIPKDMKWKVKKTKFIKFEKPYIASNKPFEHRIVELIDILLKIDLIEAQENLLSMLKRKVLIFLLFASILMI